MSPDPQDVGTGSPDREVARPAAGPDAGALERVIAGQVRSYRVAAGASLGEMADRVGISKAMLSKIENAQTSCSLTTLTRLAAGLQVPVTALFRGVDAEREAVFVPSGHGAQIVRRGSHQGHLYELLGALRGPHKRMEAVLVTLTEASEVFPLFQHPGHRAALHARRRDGLRPRRGALHDARRRRAAVRRRGRTGPSCCRRCPPASCPSPPTEITRKFVDRSRTRFVPVDCPGTLVPRSLLPDPQIDHCWMHTNFAFNRQEVGVESTTWSA